MGAFRRAEAAGAGGLELDVRISGDGELVVHHNAWLGPEARRWKIDRTPWRELLRRQPGLPRLVAVLRRYGTRSWLDLELKAPGGEAAMVAALRRDPPRRGFVVSSFDPAVLRRVHRLEPRLPLCWNVAARGALRWPRLRLACVAAHERRVTVAFLAACARRRLPVLAWTVNRPARMRQLAAMGVAGMLSDHPALLVKTLARG